FVLWDEILENAIKRHMFRVRGFVVVLNFCKANVYNVNLMLTIQNGYGRKRNSLFGFLQRKTECRSQPFRTAYIDSLLMRLYDMLNNCKAQSRPAYLP